MGLNHINFFAIWCDYAKKQFKYCEFPKHILFSAANLALAGFPLTKTLGENLPSRL